MKIEGYKIPRSSFMSVEKDTVHIINMMLKNDRLKKLIYYTTPDCMKKPDLTEEQSIALIGPKKQIRSIPKVTVNSDVLNYVIVNFDNFMSNGTNPEFRDNKIIFTIICHFDQWNLDEMQLRPYRIAAEIDTMFNNTHLSGIGELQFLGASQIILNNEFGGLTLMYDAIHGEDDKKHHPNPEIDHQMVKDFNKMYNNIFEEE